MESMRSGPSHYEGILIVFLIAAASLATRRLTAAKIEAMTGTMESHHGALSAAPCSSDGPGKLE